MRTWREFRYWSPVWGEEVSRVSVVGGGDLVEMRYGAGAMLAEYFAIIPSGSGKGYRERRSEALEQIEAAMDRGDPPGEVELKEKAHA